MDRVNVSVIGYGRWGRNWARVLSEMPEFRLVEVVDQDPVRQAQVIADGYPSWTAGCWDDTEHLKGVEAVVIATPPQTHFDLASAALCASKHVLVEKPMVLCERDAHHLWAKADCEKRILMVGHTFLYNEALREMGRRMNCHGDDFGHTYYLHSVRTNIGPIRDDISVHWDLGVHDIAIFNYLLGMTPESVSAVGVKPLSLGRGLYDAVWATLIYPGGVVAHLYVSWLEPSKVRQVTAVGSNQRIVFDDMNLEEPLKIYNRGVSRALPQTEGFGDFHYAIRDGSTVAPKIDMREPLKVEAEHFLYCIRNGQKPLTDGKQGYDTVRVLAAMDKSLAAGGEPVCL